MIGFVIRATRCGASTALATALGAVAALAVPAASASLIAVVAALALPAGAAAQMAAPADSVVPALAHLVSAPASALEKVVERFATDRSALMRRHSVDYSPERRERFRTFYDAWRQRLREIDYETLDVEGRIDWLLLDNELRYALELLDREEELFGEMAPLLPFAPDVMALQTSRRNFEPVDPRTVATLVAGLPERIAAARERIDEASPSPIVGLRAAEALAGLRRTFEDWYEHYAGYDPLFTWWVAEPYDTAAAAMESYETLLRRRVVGHEPGEDEPIVGDPIGADGMEADLIHEMIPYTPSELVEIAEEEFAWCENELVRAAREMGHGDDWRAAMEEVKTLHVEPGEQPRVVIDLAREAVEFLEARDMVTIPPLAKEVWRMEMMSPERQKVAPFFLGGEVVLVSYPTDGMALEDKLMSMRGNNVHFSRAVVHHELIPGHHFQGFMSQRYNDHRGIFSTPFWNEGGALYWELLLWDLGFPSTPEDRIGMLFWRCHRAARIIFSLNFHLGRMTPQEAIDFLVERVGHERATAEAEVRRSFNGTYSPLYQAAYMLGGLQFRALHDEVVGSGRMTTKEFHDAVLEGGRMPIEMVRVRLLGMELPRDYEASWRFADEG